MNLFRNLLFWIVLALLGALLAQALLADPGYVLVRYRGTDYTTTVAAGLLILFGTLFGLWVLWKVLSLPLRTWRRRRDARAHARLGEGLSALHQGHYPRAEKLLAQAAREDARVSGIARSAAAKAALARGDTAAANAHVEAMGNSNAASRAIAAAKLALVDGRPADALTALDAPSAQPLPPKGLALRAQALAASGQAARAYGLLGALRQQQALSKAKLDELEAQWAQAALREAGDANALADLWDRLPKPLMSDPGIVIAYADRAAALRWDDAATTSIEQALATRWDERLAAHYGALPVGHPEQRRENALRWLQAHPSSPAVLLTLARLARQQGQWPQAQEYLHRALAQGAGCDAWEEFGHGYAKAGDDKHARIAYANALRAARGEPVEELAGTRNLRQKIFDEAVIEERDAHGMPRLRG